MFFFRILLASLSLCGLLGSAAAYTNPIRNPGGGDPQISWFDGYYYLISTEWTNLQLSRATTIEGLKTATPKAIYEDLTPNRCCSVWAPEIHYFERTWYLYYTAGNADNLNDQRMHVLKGGASPWDTWAYANQVTTDWSLDGTVVRFNDWGNYFVYSCMTGVPHQSTCVRKLNDDYISASSNISIISTPDQPWEQSGVPVQEGQYALYFGGKTYIAYSANYCWTPDYCVALLEWDGVSDPATAAAWKKSDGCRLTQANGNFGTGHNSFFRSPDGSTTYITYHATSEAGGACDDRRYVMVQPISAREDGSPDFGVPQAFGSEYPEPSA
ncbi:hypothetical protein SLS61_006284 [Didymella pomorum]